MADAEPARRPQLRVVEGDSYADWEDVYADNLLGVYRLVFRQVGNRPDAEDLTEEVFLAALPRLDLPAPRLSVRAYLSATVRTVLADHWRRHYAAPPTLAFDEELPAPGPPDRPADDAGGRAARVLARLPERFRRILELRFLGGLSVGQAAAELGVTAGNARVLQHRALRRAAELAEEDAHP
ncbi:MAG TPA: sigma-70 family RNA polymerase sigma factor [Candidatus Dormibacteraeota bacterium]|nr:sigma-70 family RNA polymerase sigma factor [Candidatus Dormibacteraeota bacterium]